MPAPFSLKFLSLKSKLLLALGAAILLWQVARGLSLAAWIYPLMSALFTYADGPMRRGLLPSLLHLAGISKMPDLLLTYTFLHFAQIILLAAALIFYLRHLLAKGSEARVWLMFFLLASPVLPVLAVTSGYSDVALVLILIALRLLLSAGKVKTAALLLQIAALHHEMVLVLGLPLFLAEALLTRNRAPLLAAIAVACVSAAALAASAHFQPDLAEEAIRRCAEQRPTTASIFIREAWSINCVRQVQASLTTDFELGRARLLLLYLMVYGLFPLVLLLTAAARAWKSPRLSGITLTALMFVPLGLILIAWDGDRIVTLTAVTAWLTLDLWMAHRPSPNPPPHALRIAAPLLLAFQLFIHYPAIDFYGTYRLVPPSFARHYLLDPRDWIEWSHPYFVIFPPHVRRDYCIDPRCPKSRA